MANAIRVFHVLDELIGQLDGKEQHGGIWYTDVCSVVTDETRPQNKKEVTFVRHNSNHRLKGGFSIALGTTAYMSFYGSGAICEDELADMGYVTEKIQLLEDRVIPAVRNEVILKQFLEIAAMYHENQSPQQKTNTIGQHKRIANSIREQVGDITEYVRKGNLSDFKGVGYFGAAIINSIVRKGYEATCELARIDIEEKSLASPHAHHIILKGRE